MRYVPKLFFQFLILSSMYGCGSDTQKNETLKQGQDSLKGADSTMVLKREKLSYSEAYDKALKLWNIPFEEKDIVTSLGSAHVIISGPLNGPPLVLLHGMNASSTMWYPNIKSFSEQHRVYAIDFLLEPGKSTCSMELNSIKEIVSWYYEIFDQLKLKNFSIIGASRGGWLALQIALRDQSRIKKIVLLSPAQAFIWIRPGSKIFSNITYSLSPKRKNLRYVLETMTFDVDKLKQEYINQYFIATEEATINKCILQMKPLSDDEFRSLVMPILVLVGNHDIINNEKSLTQAKSLIVHVETGMIKDAGHFLSFDQPEIIDKKVLDFLNKKRQL